MNGALHFHGGILVNLARSFSLKRSIQLSRSPTSTAAEFAGCLDGSDREVRQTAPEKRGVVKRDLNQFLRFFGVGRELGRRLGGTRVEKRGHRVVEWKWVSSGKIMGN